MLYRTNDYYKVSRHNPKTILTFNCARNVIIETCRAESEWHQSHGWFNSTRPCFIGLCCLYGAAAHLDELCVDGLSPDDRGILRHAVSGFARRWKISGMKLCFSLSALAAVALRNTDLCVLTDSTDNFLHRLDSAKRVSGNSGQLSCSSTC
jgi:hypothetical protein